MPECFSGGGKRSISRVCCWQSEEGPSSHSEPSRSSRVPSSPRNFAFPAKKMRSCCYGESLAVSVPGTNCSKSFLVSALSSAFISQFLAKTCGLQIKMSGSRCAAEHRPWAPRCPLQSFLPESLPKVPVRRGRKSATLTKCPVFFILRGSICLFQKIWKI